MNFEKELDDKRLRIEEIIASYLPKEEGFQINLISAMNYSMLGKGKRLRPMLIEETYKTFGGRGKVCQPFMAAMEMIHTSSLVHDDLPLVDNDDYRRGRKTTHVVYGDAVGMYAGDALITYAFEVAAQAFDIEPDNKGIPKAMKILAHNSGVYGMLGGQTLDVELTGKPLDRDTLEFIHLNKTGALIQASMTIGAVLAGAADDQVELINTIAQKIGMAFQIQDDILDVVGDEALIGKPVLSDEKNDKTTYVSLYGLERAKEIETEISADAIRLLESMEHKNEFLVSLVRYLIDREK